MKFKKSIKKKNNALGFCTKQIPLQKKITCRSRSSKHTISCGLRPAFSSLSSPAKQLRRCRFIIAHYGSRRGFESQRITKKHGDRFAVVTITKISNIFCFIGHRARLSVTKTLHSVTNFGQHSLVTIKNLSPKAKMVTVHNLNSSPRGLKTFN